MFALENEFHHSANTFTIQTWNVPFCVSMCVCLQSIYWNPVTNVTVLGDKACEGDGAKVAELPTNEVKPFSPWLQNKVSSKKQKEREK